MTERMCVNAPIQGTATGDIVKIALKKVSKLIEQKKNLDGIKILAQVHDELIFEISDKTLKKIIPEIKKIMESVLENSDLEKRYKTVPLKVSGIIGKN
jgi:DNA polymerase-1